MKALLRFIANQGLQAAGRVREATHTLFAFCQSLQATGRVCERHQRHSEHPQAQTLL